MKTEIEALREALNAAIGYINALEGVADDDTLEEDFDEAITNLLELGYLPWENE